MDNILVKLFKLPNTVFTTRELALIWQESDKNLLNAKIAYYVKRGAFIRLRQGVFAKSGDYEPKELGTSIITPSYISFETVLREQGMIFQYYKSIFLASYTARTIKCGKNIFVYKKIKDIVLYNKAGLMDRGVYWSASAERAFLDMIYLAPNYFFDNLRPLDWDKCFDLAKIYQNKQLISRLNKYYKEYAE
ncbi:hypothetical protein KJ969_04540 [Patescibacteria group bacterium]|nr:hypothetical protein [Patescibacteria group bacterium]MBU1922155.1 hypothetical protein [Patescibacteria group bacterium]